MEKKILLIDFLDSFSMNIVSEFYEQGMQVDIIRYDLFLDQVNYYRAKYDCFILGPGPGHPREYLEDERLRDFVKDEIKSKSKFMLGICLGHQVIGSVLGMQVIDSKVKQHGSVVKYSVGNSDPCFPDLFMGKQIELQRYNSLILAQSKPLESKIFIGLDINNEIACLKNTSFLSYQFHPESVGTIYRKDIFLYLVNTLYNYSNELTS